MLLARPSGQGTPSPTQYPMLHPGVGINLYATKAEQFLTAISSSPMQHSLSWLMHAVVATVPCATEGTVPEKRNNINNSY